MSSQRPDPGTARDWNGGLASERDFFFPAAPEVEWLREGASFWLYEENGEFGLPRIGVEAEPSSWESRRYQANFALADGRVLFDVGVGPMHSTIDPEGQPSILGAGPLSFRCIEPFRRWSVRYDGDAVATDVSRQIAGTVDPDRRAKLRYEFELTMSAPAFVQDTSPPKFFRMGKGEQRDGLSVGLGWRLEQMLRGEGELEVDGERRAARVVGSRVKRQSIRTDGLFLRGHCWQAAAFPDGRAFGYLAYPPHEDGFDAWNEGFVYQGGRMYPAKARRVPWLRRIVPAGDDASVELHSELGVTRIEGATELSTFKLASGDLWGISLQQCGARYRWDDQTSLGMLERSARPEQTRVEKEVSRG